MIFDNGDPRIDVFSIFAIKPWEFDTGKRAGVARREWRNREVDFTSCFFDFWRGRAISFQIFATRVAFWIGTGVAFWIGRVGGGKRLFCFMLRTKFKAKFFLRIRTLFTGTQYHQTRKL